MNSDADNSFVSGVLSGKTVFLAASSKLLPELTAALCELGANVLPIAVLEAKEIVDNKELDRAIADIRRYDCIIFTSAWGVSFFSKRFASALMPDVRGVEGLPKIFAIGPATANAAEKHGFRITLIADEFTAEGVMHSLEKYYGGVKNLRGLRVLIPRALQARDFLPVALASAGCRVDVIPCYQTVMPEHDDELIARLQNQTPDLIVLTSARASRNFMETLAAALGEKKAHRRLLETTTAVIGVVTAGALESEGKSAEIIPGQSTVSALLASIADFYKSRNHMKYPG